MGLILRLIVPTTLILVLAPVGMMYFTWLERKVLARMQDRIGPNRVGPYGLLQPLADGIKMLTKEDVVPRGADRFCHFLAPVVIVVPALMLFTLIPFGPRLVAAPLATGLIFFVAIGSTQVMAIFMGGWGSRGKFSMIGALRNAAQLISYEVPMVISLAAIPLVAGSLQLSDIVEAQRGGWFILTSWGMVAFPLVVITGLAEINRTPFDLPEAESELVGGFHTEYSGMKFAMFYMAEFVSTIALSALVAVLFLGGWMGPRFLPPAAWMGLKTFLICWTLIWFRGTFPRMRIDQMMGFAWKVLLPVSLANLFGAAFWVLAPGFVGKAAPLAAVVVVYMVTTHLWLKPRPHLPPQWVRLGEST